MRVHQLLHLRGDGDDLWWVSLLRHPCRSVDIGLPFFSAGIQCLRGDRLRSHFHADEAGVHQWEAITGTHAISRHCRCSPDISLLRSKLQLIRWQRPERGFHHRGHSSSSSSTSSTSSCSTRVGAVVTQSSLLAGVVVMQGRDDVSSISPALESTDRNRW